MTVPDLPTDIVERLRSGNRLTLDECEEAAAEIVALRDDRFSEIANRNDGSRLSNTTRSFDTRAELTAYHDRLRNNPTITSLQMWVDVIDATQPSDTQRTYSTGRHHIRHNGEPADTDDR